MTALPSVAAVGGKVAKVAGLPTGLKFAAADVYAYTNAKKKTGRYLKQAGQTIAFAVIGLAVVLLAAAITNFIAGATG